MKLSEFILLSQEEKRYAVTHDGVPVAKREINDYMVFLFQLGGYYVETFCCQETKEIHEYRALYDTKHLSPYLEMMRIVIE
jgi:hypothetical protein